MNTTALQKADDSHNYSIVIGTFFALLSPGIVLATFGVFFKPLSSEFGWTRGDTSGAFSTTMIVSGIVCIILGRLADRFSPRLIIIACNTLIGCACLLLSQMNTLWHLYLFFGIMVGCGIATVIPTTSLIARTFKINRGLFTGISQAGGSIGGIISAPAITSLIIHYDWKTGYIVLGIVILIFTLICALFLRDPPKGKQPALETASPSQRNPPDLTKNLLFKAVGSLPFWLLGIILFCNGFAQNVFNVHIIPYATDIGISPIIASGILSVSQGACAFGNFSAGRSNDLIGGRLSMVICMVLISMSLILLLVADTILVFYLAAILCGIGVGGAVTLRSTVVAELFGLRSHGEITGAIMCISTIGCAIGPLAAGYIFDLSGNYKPAFLLTLVICVAGLILAWSLKFKIAAFIKEN